MLGYLGYLPPASPLESPGITMTLQHLASVSEDGRDDEGEGEGEELGDDDAIEDEDPVVRISIYQLHTPFSVTYTNMYSYLPSCGQGPESSGRYMGPSDGGGVCSSSVAVRQEEAGRGSGGEGERGEESLKILGLVREQCATETHTHIDAQTPGVVLWCNG